VDFDIPEGLILHRFGITIFGVGDDFADGLTVGVHDIDLDITENPDGSFTFSGFNNPASLFFSVSFISADGVPRRVHLPPPPPPRGPNLDTASAWAHGGINTAVDAGLVPEWMQNNFTNRITRGEFAALAVTLYETVTGSEIRGRRAFNDTDDVYVQKAGYIGVVTGTGDNNFNPNMSFNREQGAVMLSRLLAALGEPVTQEAPTFADNHLISDWAFYEVGHVQYAGIMQGFENNIFHPNGPRATMTREQSIVTILRIFEMLA